MCGRVYETYSAEDLHSRYPGDEPEPPIEVVPVYNLCPTAESPVVRFADERLVIERMRWQLVPSTEPAFTTKLATINARSESVFSKPLFRDLILQHRCIVPISGFFEWKRDGDQKRPFKIHLRDEPIMSVAGIWDAWRPGTREERRSFSILTTSANTFMSGIHDRMPVILERADENAWLDPGNQEPERIRRLLRPCLDSRLAAEEVSARINSAKNNSPDLLEPIRRSAEPSRGTPRLFND